MEEEDRSLKEKEFENHEDLGRGGKGTDQMLMDRDHGILYPRHALYSIRPVNYTQCCHINF